LANNVLADVNGEVSFLQLNYLGEVLSLTGTVALQCIEAVNTTFFSNGNGCWGSWCSYANGLNLPIVGPSATSANPSATYANPAGNGQWYVFPSGGQCSNSQRVGEGGCTWKASTIIMSASVGNLTQAGFYSCGAQNPTGYCWLALTNDQWNNSTRVLQNFGKYSTLSSTVSTSSSLVMGPVKNVNGRCVVECPAGYTFRSAFTAPYCVPSSSSSSSAGSLLASDVDVDALEVRGDEHAVNSSSSAGAVVGGAVVVVAVMAMAAALISYRAKQNAVRARNEALYFGL
jgi:hypothetical protein